MMAADFSVEENRNIADNTGKQETTWNEVKSKLRECNLQNTKFFDTAKSYGLTKEIKEVEPTLKELDFYGGYRRPKHDYRPHSMHTVHDKIQDVTLTDVLEKFEEGHLTFVGPAGIGKTTLMKYIAREVVNKEISCFEDIEIVLYIEGRNINFKAFTTAGEMLTLGTTLDKAEVHQITQFARLFPKKVLCVIDSLDTLSRSLDGVYTTITDEERAHPEVILYHLLSGQLFPGCRIITSSREHAIRNYKGELRANKVIVMTGLSRESMEQMILGYLGETKGRKELKFLETKCPEVFALCKTPVFLVYTVIVWTDNSTFKPTTLSGIMILLGQKLIHSEHAHEENINHVIDQLKLLSFRGTEQKRVLFTTAELKNYELEPVQVTDLAVIAPSGKSTKLLEKEHDHVFFSHQSIQELFTALAIVEKETEDFKSFLSKSLHLPHYSMVRRLLCGLLLDEEVRERSKNFIKAYSDEKKDQIILKQSLKTQLIAVRHQTRDKLELYISLSEAKEGVRDVISATVHDISLAHTPLSKSDVYAIGSVAKQCTVLNKLALERCGIESDSLEILDSCLEGSNVEIKSIDLSGNSSFGVKGMQAIARLTRQCHIEDLKLADCGIDKEQLEAWGDIDENVKIKSIDLSGYSLGVGGMQALARVTRQCRIDNLKLVTCQIGGEELEAWTELVGDVKIQSLDLSRNHLTIEGTQSLVRLVEQCRISELRLDGCRINEGQLETWARSVESLKISSWQMNGWTLHNSAAAELGKFLKLHSPQEFKLKNCQLDADAFACFVKNFENPERSSTMRKKASLKMQNIVTIRRLKLMKGGSQISSLDLTNNKDLSEDVMSSVGVLTKLCGIDHLDFSNCHLTETNLVALRHSAGDTKISFLNLSLSDLCDADLQVVGEIARQCRVDHLILSSDKFTAERLTAFKETAGDHKISSLKLSSEKEGMSDTDLQVVGEITRLCRVDHLILSSDKFTAESLTAFKEAAGDHKVSSLNLSSQRKGMSDVDLQVVGEIARQCKVDHLILSRNKFTAESLTAFKDAAGDHKISSLNLSSEKEGMSDTDLQVVREITRLCRVDHLILSSDKFTAESLTAFKEAAGDNKISSLNLSSQQEGISDTDLQVVAEIAGLCRVDDLNLGGRNPTAESLVAFGKAMRDHKVKTLNLNFWDNVTIDHVRAVADLLPRVTKNISLQRLRWTTAGKRYLKSELNKLYPMIHPAKVDEEKKSEAENSFLQSDDHNQLFHNERLVEDPEELLTIKMDWTNGERSSQDIEEGTDGAEDCKEKIESSVRIPDPGPIDDNFGPILSDEQDQKDEESHEEITDPDIVFEDPKISKVENSDESDTSMPTEDPAPDEEDQTSEDEKSDETMSSISKEYSEPDQLDQDSSRLEFRYHPLRQRDHQKILYALKNEPSLREMRIRDCDLRDSFFSEIYRNESRCKIKQLDVSGNEHLRNFNLMKAFMKHHGVSSLNVSECELSDQDLQSMEEQFGELEFTALDVSYNTFGDGFSSLGSTVQMCRIEELDILECGLNTQHLKAFQKAVGNHKIKRIDMSYNSDVCEEGFEILADLIATCKISQISLSGCEITSQKMERFCRKLEILTPLIEKLDVSYNDEMDTKAMTSLAKIVRLCKVSNLNVSGCGLTRTIVKEMNEELIHSCKIKVLSMRDNKLLQEGISDVVQLAVACSVEKLDISRCFWKAKHIKDFTSTIGKHKFQVLDISEPDWIPDQDYASAVMKLESHVEGKFVRKNAK